MIAYSTRRRLSLALRLAVICTLVTLTTIYYATPEPALVAYLAFFINRDDRASSDRLALGIVVIATLMIGLVFLLMQLLVEHPLGRIAAMAVLSLLLLFLTSASKLKAVGGILTLVLAFALDLMGESPLTELLTRGLLYAWLFVAIPAGVSFLVNRVLAPAPRRVLELALAQRIADCANVLRGTKSADSLQPAMAAYDTDLIALLDHMRRQKVMPERDLDAMQCAIGSSNALLLAVDVWAQQATQPVPQVMQLAATLDQMAAVFHGGGYPTEIDCQSGATTFDNDSQRSAWAALIFIVLHFSENPSLRAASAEQPPAAGTGFFANDVWSNPEHWRYAVKTTAAAMLCYFTYSLLSWPGIHTCMITCYLVSLPTVAESVEKLLLRIGGCLAGAALGLATLVLVLPQVSTAESYLLIVFAGSFIAAWFAASSQRFSYLGVQMAFAFFICVIQGSGPSYNMQEARDRIIGILLGNLVLYLITTRLWPVSIGARIEAQIEALHARIYALKKSDSYASFLQALNQTMTGLSQFQADIWRVRYERFFANATSPAAQGLNEVLQAMVARMAANTVAAVLLERNAHEASLLSQSHAAQQAPLPAELTNLLR